MICIITALKYLHLSPFSQTRSYHVCCIVQISASCCVIDNICHWLKIYVQFLSHAFYEFNSLCVSSLLFLYMALRSFCFSVHEGLIVCR